MRSSMNRAIAATVALLTLIVSFQLSAEEAASAAIYSDPEISDVDLDLWSLQPLQRPAVPQVQGQSRVQNEIDAFILHELDQKGLQPLGKADRATLLRRISIDVRGLPPSQAEQQRFLQESDWAKVVDAMLQDTAYGERWAQHWLDLVRFAETDGYEHDKVRPQAWRYRDWVIQAFNQDMPYDQFISLQLAGDELQPDNPSAILATGYLLAGPDMPDINLQEERRHVFLNDMAGNIGEVLLGFQFGCAQCHDHKTDPISQGDFYRLRACLDTIDLFEDVSVKLSPTEESVKVRGTQDGKEKPASHLWIRGDFLRPGPEVNPAVPRVVSAAMASGKDASNVLSAEHPRADLARWLTQSNHPLVARVIVNRLWQHHFGVGLSATPSDFGWLGDTPTHPELLDWLAVELIEHGWSLKHIHRLILNSTTYQLASRPATDDDQLRWNQLVQADPENDLLGRFRRQRLDGETIRDSMLAIAGTLNRDAGGPGVFPELPAEVVGTLLKDQWPVTQDITQHTRRSVYLFSRRNLRYPLFEVFDRPNANLSCPRRNQTTIAPQSLHLLNSELVRDIAADLSERVAKLEAPPEDRIEQLYQWAFCRRPMPEEIASCQSLIASAPTESDGWIDLCHAMFNVNEFIYVD